MSQRIYQYFMFQYQFLSDFLSESALCKKALWDFCQKALSSSFHCCLPINFQIYGPISEHAVTDIVHWLLEDMISHSRVIKYLFRLVATSTYHPTALVWGVRPTIIQNRSFKSNESTVQMHLPPPWECSHWKPVGHGSGITLVVYHVQG